MHKNAAAQPGVFQGWGHKSNSNRKYYNIFIEHTYECLCTHPFG